MFLETVKSEGLAHLSYIVGDGGAAAVIDPRRDCQIYVDIARRQGARITHIFETHRNEDLVTGSAALRELTGATVYHGPNPAAPVRYAETARQDDEFRIGGCLIRVLETPGHTDDSLSFALYDPSFGDEAVGVFTGDALFIGDVGRTDFYPDRAEEVAGLLFDSLRKILALGDQAILYPAHGAGSVCGSGMAAREFSTLGYERANNAMAGMTDRDAFIGTKVNEHHYQPPYFRHMEQLNLEGGGLPPSYPQPLTLAGLDKAVADGAKVIDTRPVTAFCGAHIPDAISLPVDMISAFAGWILAPGDTLVLVADSMAAGETAATHLARIGYDNVVGVFTQMMSWATAARPFGFVPLVDVKTVEDRLARGGNDWMLLDVRGKEEVEAAPMKAARHVYVGEVPARMADIPDGPAVTVMCGSGARATVAASLLKRAGRPAVDVFLGSMSAWQASGH